MWHWHAWNTKPTNSVPALRSRKRARWRAGRQPRVRAHAPSCSRTYSPRRSSASPLAAGNGAAGPFFRYSVFMLALLLGMLAWTCFAESQTEAIALLREVAEVANTGQSWHIEGSMEESGTHRQPASFTLVMRSNNQTRFQQIGGSTPVTIVSGSGGGLGLFPATQSLQNTQIPRRPCLLSNCWRLEVDAGWSQVADRRRT